MTQEDKEFLKTIEWNKEFHDALLKYYSNGIPQHIKDCVNRGYVEPYDVGAVSDELHGCTEYPN